MTKDFLEERWTFWALATVMLGLFSVTNLPWELDGYDQAKQGWTSYEMVTEGHWFYQRTSDDQGLATKPPLTGWISAALFFVTRSWDVAWRLPSLLCALLIAFTLFRSASRAYGNVAGLIAFAAFGFNLLSPRLATLAAPEYFGEMGLLTGQARTATVIAESDVLCYRLDKPGFDAILRARPELVDGLSKVITKRQAENDATLQAADADARARMAMSRASELVRRIRKFFEIAG